MYSLVLLQWVPMADTLRGEDNTYLPFVNTKLIFLAPGLSTWNLTATSKLSLRKTSAPNRDKYEFSPLFFKWLGKKCIFVILGKAFVQVLWGKNIGLFFPEKVGTQGNLLLWSRITLIPNFELVWFITFLALVSFQQTWYQSIGLVKGFRLVPSLLKADPY